MQAMDPASETPAGIAFGRFRLLPHRRELLADGQPVKLGGRAFDVLMALVEARGAVVNKDALMARVWPDRIVDENNLQAQIVRLRKALGAEYDLIRTVAGRGYQFTGEVRILSASPYGGVRCRSGLGGARSEPAADKPAGAGFRADISINAALSRMPIVAMAGTCAGRRFLATIAAIVVHEPV